MIQSSIAAKSLRGQGRGRVSDGFAVASVQALFVLPAGNPSRNYPPRCRHYEKYSLVPRPSSNDNVFRDVTHCDTTHVAVVASVTETNEKKTMHAYESDNLGGDHGARLHRAKSAWIVDDDGFTAHHQAPTGQTPPRRRRAHPDRPTPSFLSARGYRPGLQQSIGGRRPTPAVPRANLVMFSMRPIKGRGLSL